MPQDLKPVHALMSGVGHYIRRITSFLRKDVQFTFTPAMEEAIAREILAELATPPIPVFPDWNIVADGSRPFHVYCCHILRSTDSLHVLKLIFSVWTTFGLGYAAYIVRIMQLAKLSINHSRSNSQLTCL